MSQNQTPGLSREPSKAELARIERVLEVHGLSASHAAGIAEGLLANGLTLDDGNIKVYVETLSQATRYHTPTPELPEQIAALGGAAELYRTWKAREEPLMTNPMHESSPAMSSPERTWAERPIKVSYMSCGCLVWDPLKHDIHPNSIVVGVETRNVRLKPGA